MGTKTTLRIAQGSTKPRAGGITNNAPSARFAVPLAFTLPANSDRFQKVYPEAANRECGVPRPTVERFLSTSIRVEQSPTESQASQGFASQNTHYWR